MGTINANYLTELSEDTTPQLGGDLDANGHNIAGRSAAQLQGAADASHTQNTDTKLDESGANEVTAAQAKAGYTHSGVTTGNPHSVSKTDVGLGDVPNTDCTDASNIDSGELASPRMASATTSAQGAVELATVAEANAGSDSTRAVTADGLLLIKPASPGSAYVRGDLTGLERGTNALDIQSYRSDNAHVASGYRSSAFGYDNEASGSYSSAIGYYNEASGNYDSSAIGYSNEASGSYSSAIGYYNTASGYGSSAIGYYNTASGNYSSAIGYYNTASGSASSAIGNRNTASGGKSSAIGYRVTTAVNNTCEVGYWSNSSTRAGAVRMHPNGQVAFTIEDSATAPVDGGATHGSEDDGDLPRGMFCIQKNGAAVTLYYCDPSTGDITSLGLGNLT